MASSSLETYDWGDHKDLTEVKKVTDFTSPKGRHAQEGRLGGRKPALSQPLSRTEGGGPNDSKRKEQTNKLKKAKNQENIPRQLQRAGRGGRPRVSRRRDRRHGGRDTPCTREHREEGAYGSAAKHVSRKR